MSFPQFCQPLFSPSIMRTIYALYCSVSSNCVGCDFFPSLRNRWKKIMINLHENGRKMIDKRAHQSIISDEVLEMAAIATITITTKEKENA